MQKGARANTSSSKPKILLIPPKSLSDVTNHYCLFTLGISKISKVQKVTSTLKTCEPKK